MELSFSPVFADVGFLFAIHALVPKFKNSFVVGFIILRMLVSTAIIAFDFFTGKTTDYIISETLGEGLIWSVAWLSYFWVLRKM